MEMLKDSPLTGEKDLWWEMAFADTVVDLFDELTWGCSNYAPLVNLVHQKSGLHALYQQRCKNYVQMTALTASTNVKEGRRSDRANTLSCVMRKFNRKVAMAASKL